MKHSRIFIHRFFCLLFVLVITNIHAQGGKKKSFFDEDQCIKCHTENEMLPEGFNDEDVHIQPGLSCSGCHGGDPSAEDADEAMNPEKGFVGAPEYAEIPQFCGKCHSDIKFMRRFQPRMETDQLQQYFTSIHGKQLRKGDENVAVCSSCHTAHSIFSSKDPRSSVYALNVPATCNECHGDSDLMDEYNLPSNQYEEYSQSVHGKALLETKDIGAPACNDCHGNHGAIPPGTISIVFVCGNCHVNNINYFRQTRMAKAFQEYGFHGCVECHGNHLIQKSDDKFVGVQEGSFCIRCHISGEKGYDVAKKINTELTNLSAGCDSARTALADVQMKGMNDLDIEYILKDANQSLIQARTAVHTFDDAKVSEITGKGSALVKEALTKADKEIAEYHYRRKSFAAATLIITIFALGLFLKIRDLEKKKSA